MHCIFLSDQHFYENQTKNMGSLAITKNLNSDLKSTQKNTKKTHDSPMHYFHFLFNIGKLHCGFYIWGVLGGSWYSWHNPDFFLPSPEVSPSLLPISLLKMRCLGFSFLNLYSYYNPFHSTFEKQLFNYPILFL